MLPKTRSGKIMRRLLRELASSGEVKGDTTTLEDFGILGATTTTSRATGGTDSTSFNNAGLPGIGASQDTIEYNSHTHHTNLDTYERIVPEDVMKDAIITASVVYHVANRDKMLPRFGVDAMPPPPAQRGGRGAGVPAQQ